MDKPKKKQKKNITYKIYNNNNVDFLVPVDVGELQKSILKM